MQLLHIPAAAMIGAATALGAGLLVDTAPAQADVPPGTYWCWSPLVPNYQQCPEIPPWGSRWKACGHDPLPFVLDDLMCPAPPDPYQTYTFNCWGHDMILGKICPPLPPGPDSWLPCPNLPGHVYTLDGGCTKP